MKKSTITCDMEGVILTMNQGAVDIFGYSKEELIGKKRVSIFSPGEIVLQNVADWLNQAVENGSYEGKTFFLNKSGNKINAKIRITPTYSKGKKGEQTGYCGVTEVIDENVNVDINFSTKLIKLLAITRLPFTSASILPILVVASYFASVGDNLFSLPLLILSTLGVLLAHLSINMYNDYFDVSDGTDENNSEYFQQLSGGSRSVELGLITLKNTQKYAKILTLSALLIGVILMSMINLYNLIGVLVCLIIGLFLGYYYTAPPLRLVSRNGLGELSIFLAFGPILTLGTAFAIFTGDINTFYNLHFANVLYIGIPLGLLTTNILLINQFPDTNSDRLTGKNHLVVTFGKKLSRWIYLFILILTIISTTFLPLDNNLFKVLLITILLLSTFYLTNFIFKNYKNRYLIKANWLTIVLQAFFSIILLILFLI